GGESYEAGEAGVVRAHFADRGKLRDVADSRFRAIDDDLPVFALAHDFGTLRGRARSAYWSLGRFESPGAIDYMGEILAPLWSRHWVSWQEMADDFLSDARAARARASGLDESITAAATKAGGPGYAALCALALRQAYGACQLVAGPQQQPWAFLKEISSDDDISTVDIIFASCAVWLYLDPGHLAMLLEPILSYADSRDWTERFAPHGLGTWPRATGNPLGAASEPMPIQESGGMLVMLAGYARRDPTRGRSLLARYEGLLSRWADLVASELPVPPRQLTTVDYLGSSKGDVNLGALGIVALGATAQIQRHLGEDLKAARTTERAKALSERWSRLAMDRSGKHLDTEIGSGGTWSGMCNAYWDRALQTNLLPARLENIESGWYHSRLDTYGLALRSTWPSLARVDQQAWIAAWLHGHRLGQDLIDAVVRYVGHTSLRAPFPDNYDPVSGGPGIRYNWQARPVVGGVFALLGLT
ncbi:MAG: glutaminase domain-containing protein, partial [Acidimicrobiales bacterium]